MDSRFLFPTDQDTWTSLVDIVQVLNIIPSMSALVRLPTRKIGSNQLESSAWTEFLYCKCGEYEQGTIEIYSYANSDLPTSIIHPKRLELRLIKGIPFFILTSQIVNPITKIITQNYNYETVVVDALNKRFTNEDFNLHVPQDCINRYLNGKFFIFPKTFSDDLIDRIILQYEL